VHPLDLIMRLAPPYRVHDTCGFLDRPAEAWEPGVPADPTRIHVDGRWIKDGQGRTLLLHGVNVSAAAKVPPHLPLTDPGHFRRLAAWGLNAIRLLVVWEALEPERGRYNETYLDAIVRLIEAAWAEGIFTVVDFHQDLFARAFHGDGAPAWALPLRRWPPLHRNINWFFNYFDSHSVKEAFMRFWSNTDGIRDSYAALLAHVARRCARLPGVLGYDIMNEPMAPVRDVFTGRLDRDILPPFYRQMGQAIRAEDPHRLLFIEPGPIAAFSFPSLLTRRPLNMPNLVYAPHFYDQTVSTTRHFNGDLRNLIRSLNVMSHTAARLGASLTIGEFGALNHPDNPRAFYAAQLAQFDRYLVNWFAWNYTPCHVDWNREDASIVAPDGSERPPVAVIIRPYPRATAGTLHTVYYHAPTRDFLMAYRPMPGVTGPTEIFLPASRHYPDGFQVAVRGGDWMFDETRELLLVETDRRATRCVVCVRRS
jgi:endoglycosylceramidase